MYINSQFLSALVLSSLAWLCYQVYNRSQVAAQRKAIAIKHGCQPPAAFYPNKDIFGFTLIYNLVKANGRHEMIQFVHGLHKTYGKTFVNKTCQGIGFFTCDVENIKAIHTTTFEDWAVKRDRQAGFKELLGDGIFTTDGPFWAHSRAMIRPQFEKHQITELEQFETHIPQLIAQIPAGGSTIDLGILFHKFTMDTSTEFLTGESTNSLDPSQGEKAQKFVEDFEYAMADGALRARLGWIYFLWRHPRAKRSIKSSRDFIEHWVQRAMEYRSSLPKGETTKKSAGKYVFINELAKHEEVDEMRIRDETINILLAGRDTTASLLTDLWFVLARRPDVWNKLQSEVDELHGDLPTYETLKNMKYIKHCVQETLRLYPPVPFLQKRAVRDTIIPRGGGQDGDQPVLVPNGNVIIYSTHALMRDPDIYGADSEEFRPERWASPTLRPLWGYIPFGGGPRVCLGQNYALTEAEYVTVRLMQTFRKIENRDPIVEWKCRFSATCVSYWGAQVALSGTA